jgi:hypothetical protein
MDFGSREGERKTEDMDKETRGYLEIDGLPSCQSSKTLDVSFRDEVGKKRYVVCAIQYKDFPLMKEALLKKHPESTVVFREGRCPRPDDW